MSKILFLFLFSGLKVLDLVTVVVPLVTVLWGIKKSGSLIYCTQGHKAVQLYWVFVSLSSG